MLQKLVACTDIDHLPHAKASPSIVPVIVAKFVDLDALAIVCWGSGLGHHRRMACAHPSLLLLRASAQKKPGRQEL